MPNWSLCCYKIIGKKQKIVKILRRLEKRKTSPVINGFGTMWWGNIVYYLGGDWNIVPCRGEVLDWENTREVLTINSEFAWSEREELRDFLVESCGGDIQIYYCQEEPGNAVYETNDSEGLFFPERYKLDAEFEPFPEYFETLEGVSGFLSEFFGKLVEPKEESIEKAIEDWENEHNDWIGFNKYIITR